MGAQNGHFDTAELLIGCRADVLPTRTLVSGVISSPCPVSPIRYNAVVLSFRFLRVGRHECAPHGSDFLNDVALLAYGASVNFIGAVRDQREQWVGY